MIGPAVNLASRIEGLCPVLGADLLMSSAFKERLDPAISLESLGHHHLKGIAEPVEVFRPAAEGPQ